MLRHLTVRDTEAIARRIAFDRVRKKEYLYAPEILEMERELTEALGTRVAIEPKEHGGKLSIDYMSEEDLRAIFSQLASRIASTKSSDSGHTDFSAEKSAEVLAPSGEQLPSSDISSAPIDDRTEEEKKKDENTFDPSSFSI
jgi:hypothetical protein